MRYTPAQLGEWIKLTRTRLGVTQETLAMSAGTGMRFIVDLEKGKPTCQLGKAITVLNTLGIQIILTSPAADTNGLVSIEQHRDIG